MSSRYDIALMVKVADMYYNRGLKQDEIAKELQISRSSISMILTEARENGIVEIRIKNPLVNDDELPQRFEAAFNIKKCFIIPTKIQDSEILTKLVGERMAHVFNEEVEDNNTVGIAWGRTCYECMSSFKSDKKLAGVDIVPLVGASDRVARRYQLNEMVRIFATKVGGSPTFIYAPAVPSLKKDKDLYMKSSSMQEILKKWRSLDIALIGVGSPPSDDFMVSQNTGQAGTPVGDICARHFDTGGNFIIDEFYNRIIGITPENLRKAKKVICAAAGLEKSVSILGALKTNIIDIFISDEQTAREVLKAMNKQ